MAEPRVRFKRNDGSSYPPLVSGVMGDYYTERNEKGNSSLAFLTVSIHSGISDGELDEDSLGKRVKRTTDPAQNKKVESGDLVFNMMRAWQGAVGCAKSAGMVSPAYVVACPDARIYPPYMDLYVKTKPIVDQFNRLSYGALDFRKRLYWDSFITTEINLPCIEEQQKIADFLSSVDEIITASEQEVANLETQKKAVMKKVFSQEVRFKREDGSAFPEWAGSYRLADVSDFITKGATPTTYGFDWVEKGIPFFRNDAIRDNTFVYGDFSYISEEAHSALGRSEIKAGDLLIAITGEIGKVGMVPKEIEKGNINQHTARVRIISEYIPYFVYQYLCSDSIQNVYKKIKTGLSMAQLSLEQIRNTEIPIVDIEEQSLIAEFLSDFDVAITAAKKELELWKELKKGLLQQMFV